MGAGGGHNKEVVLIRRPLALSPFVVAVLSVTVGCGDSTPTPGSVAPDAAAAEDTGEPAVDSSPGVDVGGADLEVPDLAPPPAPDAGVDGPSAYPRPEYRRLVETGYFGDGAGPAPGAELQAFEPAHPLWSDGTSKRRWVRLPAGTRIDSSEMDHWRFPIGTKVWKEFSRDGVLLETRLIERYGPGGEDYWMGAFVWTADQKDAVYLVDGAQDINGTGHDAPAAKLCGSCHRGDKGRVLGLSALQLSHDRPGPHPRAPGRDGAAVPLARNRARPTRFPVTPPPRRLSATSTPTAATATTRMAPPGRTPRWSCGFGSPSGWPPRPSCYKNLVGRRLQTWRHPTLTERVVAGDPDASGLLARMKIRGSKDQMPSLATELIDPLGIELLTRWIEALPR